MRTDGLDFSHAPPPDSDQDAMAVLHEEILKSMRSMDEKAIQPTWLLTVPSIGSVSDKVVENEGGDDPNCLHMSLSPAGCASLVPPCPSHSPPTPMFRSSLLRLEIQFLFLRLQLWVGKSLREHLGFQQLKFIWIRLGQ